MAITQLSGNRTRSWRVGAGALATVLAMQASPAAQAVQAMPRGSASIYVSSTSSSTAYNQGCSQGTADAASPVQSSEVILDFGGQNSGNTGSILINGTSATYAQIATYAEQYALGYYVCTGSAVSAVLTLGIGTNNSAYQLTTAGGATWGSSVVSVANSWVSTNGYGSQVTIGAANDMEPGWESSGPARTEAWVQGYASSNAGRLIDYGSADGCPQTSYNNGACVNGWYQYDLWYISWGNPVSFALPEIYYSSLSKQWTMISRYGYYYQSARLIYFDGPMTEYGTGGTYTGSQAWNQFWTDLNGSSSTAVNFKYRTDI